MPDPMNDGRFQMLLQRYLDGVLQEADFAEFERFILTSPGSREIFWQATQWNGLLRHWGEVTWGRDETMRGVGTSVLPAGAGRIQSGKQNWNRAIFAGWPQRIVAAVGVIFLLGSGAFWWREKVGSSASFKVDAAEPSRPMQPSSELRQPGVALLKRSLNVVWSDPSQALLEGASLQACGLRVESGVMELEFVSGARIITEGPLDLELTGPLGMRLGYGKFRALVPDSARGFTVITDDLALVDLGTEFGFLCTLDGNAELQVMQGAVEVRSQGQMVHTLRANEAASLHEGRFQPGAAQSVSFLGAADLERLGAADARRHLEAWQAAGDLLDEDPHLLLRLDFQDMAWQSRTLSNRARHATAGSEASLVGCDRAEGRWPGKGAAEFKHADDRMWLRGPAVMEAATFIAWVRADMLMYDEHVLLRAHGPGGRMKWSLRDGGALTFSQQVHNDGKGWLGFSSGQKLKPCHLGTWLCLATVVAGDGTISHYLNGAPAGSGALLEKKSWGLGRCEIGNSATAPGSSGNNASAEAGPPDHFVGRMEEFAIFSTALSPADIHRLHALGRGVPQP